MRNEEKYNDRTDNIKRQIVRQSNHKHTKAHSERVDNKKYFSAESVW